MSSATDMAQLPDDVREKLAELELELSEGEWLVILFVFWLCQMTTMLTKQSI